MLCTFSFCGENRQNHDFDEKNNFYREKYIFGNELYLLEGSQLSEIGIKTFFRKRICR